MLMKHLSLFLSACALTASFGTQVLAAGARTGGIDYPDLNAAIEAAEEGATVTMLQDEYFISFDKCITLDMNGYSISELYIQNLWGTVTVKNGHITGSIDGASGDYTAFVGNVVLEDMIVDRSVWIDGHYYEIKSGTYNEINNHRCADHYGSAYISGNKTYVNSFNNGGWDYDGGEVFLLGGTYPEDPRTTWGRVWVDETRTVQVLDNAPEGAPASNYVYQVYDDGTPASSKLIFTEEESNNEYYEANNIAPNCTVSGTLGEEDGWDYFKVILPEEGDLVITTQAHGDLCIYFTTLFAIDSDYNLYPMFDENMTVPPASRTATGLKAGTYYIRVYRYSGGGSYDLTTQFIPCAYNSDSEEYDNDNDFWYAQQIVVDRNYQGRLGYSYASEGDGEDWYQFELDEAGALTFATCSQQTLDLLYLQLYTADYNNELQEVFFMYLGQSGTTDPVVKTQKDFEPGTYYMRISRNYGYGGYAFSVNKGNQSGIESVRTDAESALRFDIYGRPVSSDAKGLILQRGHKMVIR